MNANQVSAQIQNGSADTSKTVPNLVIARGETPLPALKSAGRQVNDLARRESPPREATLVVMATALGESRRRWIQRLREVVAVREVTELRGLEQVMVKLKPDILVVDLALPGLRRARGLRDIQRLSPSTKIVALTDSPTQGEGVFAIKAGARGYCARAIDPELLKKAVAAVQKGEIWAPRNLVSGLIAELVSVVDSRKKKEGSRSTLDPRLEGLTARQRVVADLISGGACNKEVASRLHITERTVKAHLTQAFRNFGVSDRLQLALLLNGRRSASD